MGRKHQCQARQFGDQMSCGACGITWDTNDPDPPACHNVDRRTKRFKDAAAFERVEATKVKGLPTYLSDELAAEMVKTFNANKTDGVHGHIRGMQAAYRLFLDRVEL